MSTKMRVNVLDYFAFPGFLIAASVALGLLSSTIAGFDLGATVLDLGSGHAFSVANVAAILCLAWVAYSNDWSSDMALTGIQAWLVIATVGLLIAPPFFPVLESTLASTPAALAALFIQAGGFVTFSYLG
jgi:asparagine N-glycosylation enzyme membrane subunit Stt3